jgi:hypothetical protein
MIYKEENVKEILNTLLDLQDKSNYAKLDLDGFVDFVEKEYSIKVEGDHRSESLKTSLLSILNGET